MVLGHCGHCLKDLDETLESGEVKLLSSGFADYLGAGAKHTHILPRFDAVRCRCRHPREWHLNLGKPFGHLAFDLSARFSQVREFLVISFPSPRLVAIRAIGDAVGGDGVEQDLVQA